MRRGKRTDLESMLHFCARGSDHLAGELGWKCHVGSVVAETE
jgi:hypothetical protein